MNNPYDTLGIDPDASDEDIKKAYRAKARESHPDAGGDEKEFQELSIAYDVLSDPLKRRKYDKEKKLPESPNLEKMAADIVLAMFNDSLTKYGIEADLVTKTKLKIKERLAHIPMSLKHIDKIKKKTENLISRIEHKDSEYPDIIGLALQNNLNDIKIEEMNIMDQQKALKIAKKMIDGYTCKPGQGPSTLAGLLGQDFGSFSSTMSY